jgi:chromosome segregation ATPase
VTIDERIEALTMNLELLSHSSEAHERRFSEVDGRIDKLTVSVDRLQSSVERLETSVERLEASVETLAESAGKLVDVSNQLVKVSNEDAVHIRQLARIADAHENRITGLEERGR